MSSNKGFHLDMKFSEQISSAFRTLRQNQAAAHMDHVHVSMSNHTGGADPHEIYAAHPEDSPHTSMVEQKSHIDGTILFYALCAECSWHSGFYTDSKRANKIANAHWAQMPAGKGVDMYSLSSDGETRYYYACSECDWRGPNYRDKKMAAGAAQGHLCSEWREAVHLESERKLAELREFEQALKSGRI